MRKSILLTVCTLFIVTVNAQKVIVKNNLLYDAALIPNISVGQVIGKRTTLDLSFAINPFTYDNGKKWKLWLVQPELRFWMCDLFNGGFWGVHALGGEYNWKNVRLPFGLGKDLRNHRYEGWYTGGGISYGYHWILTNRISLEASAGLGYARIYYEKYTCGNCDTRLKKSHTNYFGPTKASLALLFSF